MSLFHNAEYAPGCQRLDSDRLFPAPNRIVNRPSLRNESLRPTTTQALASQSIGTHSILPFRAYEHAKGLKIMAKTGSMQAFALRSRQSIRAPPFDPAIAFFIARFNPIASAGQNRRPNYDYNVPHCGTQSF
jgi:hypothetical protein